jgi:hypothetical protein
MNALANRLLRATAAFAPLMLTGCGRAPAFDVLVRFSLRGWFVLQSAFCSPSYVEHCCNRVSKLLSQCWCTQA